MHCNAVVRFLKLHRDGHSHAVNLYWGRFPYVMQGEFYDGPANFRTSENPPDGGYCAIGSVIGTGETLVHDTSVTVERHLSNRIICKMCCAVSKSRMRSLQVSDLNHTLMTNPEG